MLAKLFLVMLLVQPTWAQNPTFSAGGSEGLQPKLQTHERDYRLSANSFLEALTVVAGQFEIPMGIQWIRNERTLAKVNASWKDATVYDIIRSIAESQPGYKVNLSHGVLHVFPEGLLADQRNFLNLRIKNYEVEDALFAVATMKLEELVRQIISPPPPAPPGSGIGANIGSTPGEALVTVQLGDATVSEALDALSLHSDDRVWVVTFCEGCGLTRTGFRRTVQLWLSTTPPDELQPAWNAFRWGQQIPSSAFTHGQRSTSPKAPSD